MDFPVLHEHHQQNPVSLSFTEYRHVDFVEIEGRYPLAPFPYPGIGVGVSLPQLAHEKRVEVVRGGDVGQGASAYPPCSVLKEEHVEVDYLVA